MKTKFWNREESNARVSLRSTSLPLRLSCVSLRIGLTESTLLRLFCIVTTTTQQTGLDTRSAREWKQKKESGEEEHKQVEKYKYCFSIASHLSAIAFTRTNGLVASSASSQEYHNEECSQSVVFLLRPRKLSSAVNEVCLTIHRITSIIKYSILHTTRRRSLEFIFASTVTRLLWLAGSKNRYNCERNYYSVKSGHLTGLCVLTLTCWFGSR